VGGELNAYTTKEETTLYSTFLPSFTSELPNCSAIFFLTAPIPKRVETRKEVVLEEINSYKDSPSELILMNLKS
jgi:predicted Zn-dependent peptidase